MDNKVTKKRINDHLEYDWFKYILILIVGIVLWVFVYGQIERDRDYETIDIFISAYASYENQYVDKTYLAMANAMDSKYGQDVIRSLNLNVQNPLGNEYGTLLMTQGNESSDVLILGDKLLQEGAMRGYIELTDELLNDYLLPDVLVGGKQLTIDDLEYIYYEAPDGTRTRHGIRVDTFAKMSGTQGAAFETNYKNVEAYKEKDFGENLPDTTFYLVLNPKSVSLGKFGKKSEPQNAQALFCVQKFIEYYIK